MGNDRLKVPPAPALRVDDHYPKALSHGLSGCNCIAALTTICGGHYQPCVSTIYLEYVLETKALHRHYIRHVM